VKYRVSLSGQAQKLLVRMDRPTRDRIVRRLQELAESPSDPRLSKLLTLGDGKRSARVGGLRIIFVSDHDGRELTVLTIVPRGRAYREV